jgi:subtilisin family serine protease
MRLLPPLLLAAILAAPVAAQESRLDPTLRALLRAPDQARAAPAALSVATAADVHEFPYGIAVESGLPGEEPRVGVFVRLASPAGLDELRAAGAEIGSVIGDIVTARVPLGALGALGQSAAMASIEAARVVPAEHDSSMIAIDVDKLRTLSGESWLGATGQGSIVGIYDTGLDVMHGDFIAPDGTTRVLGLWDQINGTRSPPPGFNRGFYCTRDAVQQRIAGTPSACPSQDIAGHGTHVAGSAAGDGSSGSTPFRYAGVAPNADLLIVKGGNGSFSEDLIVDGLAWLKQEAQRLGRPAVANLSLGGQFGPHDGTRLYEQAIDELSGPGFMVVVSAGNQGTNQNTTPETGAELIHARGFATGTEPRDFTFEITPYPPGGCAANFVRFDMWYEADDRLRIEVIRPGGATTAANPGALVEDDDSQGNVEIDNGSFGADPDNGDFEAHISVDACGSQGRPAQGIWTIRVTPTQPGSGQPYDLWMYSQQFSGSTAAHGRQGFDNQFIVGSPGNATEAITVGAFVTRLCWPSESSPNICYTQQEELGDLARFSGGGPRRDGVLKPEIAAPGLGIASAKSRDVSAPANRVLPDGVHWVIEGTSMAAPHMTGAIAILYACDPTLSSADVRAALQTTARQDEFTTRMYGVLGPSPQPSDWWGFGKLNVRDALLHLTGDAPTVLTLSSQSAIPDTTTLGEQGTRLPLLRLLLGSGCSAEPIRVLGLSFDVRGSDPGARLLLVEDANANGRPDPSEPVLGSAPAPLDGDVTRVEIVPASFVIPEVSHRDVIVAIELSGGAPNGAEFEATFVADATRSIGTETQVENAVSIISQPAPSGVAETTVLGNGEEVSFSENPIRREFVIFNFIEAPTTAAIYTVAGRRVADLVRRVGTGELRVEWDLTNDDGGKIAPGVYLLVFSVQGTVFREKLFVLRPGGSSVPDREEP